jgi:hypothetical protein
MKFSNYKIGTKFTSLPTSLRATFKAATKQADELHGKCTVSNAPTHIATVAGIIGEKYPSHLNFAGMK